MTRLFWDSQFNRNISNWNMKNMFLNNAIFGDVTSFEEYVPLEKIGPISKWLLLSMHYKRRHNET